MEATNLLFITLSVTVLLPMTTMESHETCSVTTTPPIECALSLKTGARNHMDLICSAFNKQENCGKLSLQSFVFNLRCNEEYISVGSSVYTLHINGSWTPRLPECKRWCEPLKSLTMDIQCEYKGEKVDCNKHVPVGTEATGQCKVEYLPTEKAANSTVCNEYGQWSQNFIDCVTPACGITNSTESVPPWVVLIYRDGSLVCFGTLISPIIILTAAHCVYSESERHAWNMDMFELMMGNLEQTPSTQELKDKAIHVTYIAVPPKYFGRDTNYVFNIALMKLETRVLHTPACLDWDREFHFIPREIGTMTCMHNDVLSYSHYKYMDYGSCVSGLVHQHRRYLTPDKFCNKPLTKPTGSLWDTGTGLMFKRNGVYFVMAVVHHGWYSLDDCIDCISFAMNLSDTGLLHWLKQTMESFNHDMNNDY